MSEGDRTNLGAELIDFTDGNEALFQYLNIVIEKRTLRYYINEICILSIWYR